MFIILSWLCAKEEKAPTPPWFMVQLFSLGNKSILFAIMFSVLISTANPKPL